MQCADIESNRCNCLLFIHTKYIAMRKVYHLVSVLALVLFTACSSPQSLQEYYVDNAENPNFLKFDVPSSILNVADADLSAKQREALKSLKKLNILAFKKSSANATEYEVEKTKVKAILKNEDFVQLMKMNTPYGKATIKYLGNEDAIDEVIIYGDNDEKGFALIRILGDEMNPAHLVQLIEAIQKSDYSGEGFGQLEELFKG